MALSLDIGNQIAAGDANLRQQLLGYKASNDTLSAKYGADPTTGALDFIDPKDPFSITGAAKRLFRDQQDAARYSAFAGGYGHDGSTGEAAAKDQIEQFQKERNITDDYKAGIGANNAAATQAIGGWGADRAGLNAQLTASFADENNATLGAAPKAAAGVGEKGGAPSTAVKHEFKRVGKQLYRRIQGSTQKWVPIPG